MSNGWLRVFGRGVCSVSCAWEACFLLWSRPAAGAAWLTGACLQLDNRPSPPHRRNRKIAWRCFIAGVCSTFMMSQVRPALHHLLVRLSQSTPPECDECDLPAAWVAT